MSEWVVTSCDVCKRQTITEHVGDMVVCETCLRRWDAEDEAAGEAAGVPSGCDFDFDCDAGEDNDKLDFV